MKRMNWWNLENLIIFYTGYMWQGVLELYDFVIKDMNIIR